MFVVGFLYVIVGFLPKYITLIVILLDYSLFLKQFT